MTIRPLRNMVLLRRAKKEETTDSGLFIPSAAQKESNLAEVLATGPGRISDSGKLIRPTVSQGDIVLIGEWIGDKVTAGDEELLLVEESQIWAIMDMMAEIKG